MHGRLTVCLCMLSCGRNMLSDPSSISGDSDLRFLNDCFDRVSLITGCAYNLCA